MAQPDSYVPDPSDSPEGEGALIGANRLKLFVGALALIGALGFFGFMAFENATVYYYTVGEATDLGPSDDGRMVRVNGKLIPSSFDRESGSTQASFQLTDGSQTMLAVHDGVLPDLFFNDHSEIILEGTFDGEMVFRSENVIVKCPSKYVAQEDETG
jgi:cytochrome c-type biogenesis protein CcmE